MTESTGRGTGTALVLAAACWGVGTVMTKGVLEQVPPLTLLVVQLLASLFFLWSAVLLRRVSLSLRGEAWRMGLAGLLNPGLAYTFALLGLVHTTASMSSLLWAAEPALILALAWLLLRERLSRPQVLLALVAIGGAVVVVAGGTPQTGGSLLGNGLVLAAVLCCALYTILTRAGVQNLDPLFLTAVQQSVSLVWALLVWTIGRGSLALDSLASLPPTVWAWALASGLVYYGLAFWFYITGLKGTSASVAGLFLNLIPIFGIGAAHLFLNEQLTVAQWIGAALILGAVIAISRISSAPPVVVPEGTVATR